MTDETVSLITTMSMNGNSSLLKRGSLTAPALWVLVGIATLHLNAPIHASFVKPVNPKPTVHVTRAMPKHARRLGLEIGTFFPLHTHGRQLNQHPLIHLSVTRDGLSKYDA